MTNTFEVYLYSKNNRKTIDVKADSIDKARKKIIDTDVIKRKGGFDAAFISKRELNGKTRQSGTLYMGYGGWMWRDGSNPYGKPVDPKTGRTTDSVKTGSSTKNAKYDVKTHSDHVKVKSIDAPNLDAVRLKLIELELTGAWVSKNGKKLGYLDKVHGKYLWVLPDNSEKRISLRTGGLIG